MTGKKIVTTTKKIPGWRASTSTALALICSSTALSLQASDNNKQSKIIEEIVVTAQKSAAGIQDVPLAVTALSGNEMAFRGISDLASLQSTVPSLNFSERGGVSFVSVRGVGLNVDVGGGEPAVAQHIDGIYQPRATTGTMGMADLARVEVLRGPQGTLYGRNATGGAINFVLNRPTDELEGKIVAGMGNFAAHDGAITGIVSGPLIDGTLNGRAMIDYSKDKGHITNVTTGNTLADLETLEGRVAVSVFPNAPFSADFSVLYRKDRHLETANVLVTPPDPFLETSFSIVPPTQSNPNGYIENDYRNVKLTTDPEGERDAVNIALTLNWELSWGSVKSITGFQDHEISRQYDDDNTERDVLNVGPWRDTSTSLSQEFNLAFEGDWGRALIGAYYFTENYFVTTPIDIAAGAGGVGIGVTQFGDSDVESRAVFADITYNVGESFRLLGGIRYTEDVKEMNQTVNLNIGSIDISPLGTLTPDEIDAVLVGLLQALPTPDLPLTPAPLVASIAGQCSNNKTEKKFDSLDPRVGFQVDLTEDMMLYSHYQTGYKSGDTFYSTCNNTYVPEEVESIEVGIKSSWLDGAMTANAAIFHNDYTNFQVFKLEGIRGLVVNAPEARVQGAELETVIRPLESVKLDLTATWLDAIYQEFFDTDSTNPQAGPQDLSDNRLNRAPKYTFNLGAEYFYYLNMASIGEIRLRLEYYRTSDIAFRPYGTSLDRQEGYALVNAVTTIASSDDKFVLRVFGRNLTDEKYYSHIYATQLGYRNGPSGIPRNYGIEGTYHF